MNFCKNCGKDIPNPDQKFCPNCGTPVQAETPVYQPSESYNSGISIPSDRPMKWYKFLIYFSLFASAVLNVINGFQYLTGSIWETLSGGYTNADAMYRIYEGLQFADIVFGAGLIGLGVLAIVTRNKLARFEAKGPELLNLLYLGALILSVAYVILVSMICNIDIGDMLEGSNIVSIVVSLAMVVANKKYFENRRDLFVN